MAAILHTLEEEYGGAEGWLREQQWDDAQLEQLRDRLTR